MTSTSRIAIALALVGWLSGGVVMAPVATAQEIAAAPSVGLAARVGAVAARDFAIEQAELARLRASNAPSDKVDLAELLRTGPRVSAKNPLRVPQREEAIALLRQVARTSGDAAVAADAELGALLSASADASERDEGIALLRRAAAAGDGGSAVRLANAILSTRFGDTEAEAEARRLYANALAKKEPGAAEGFARLAADPAVAATYRAQAMMLMKLRSDQSGAAAFALAEAYRTGFGVATDKDAAQRYYRQALATGYAPAVSIYVSSSESAGAEIVDGLATALLAGSRDAALALCRAFVNRSSLPVSGEDTAYLIALLRETGNPDAAIIEARLLLEGRTPFTQDVARAEAAVGSVIADVKVTTPTLLSFGRQIRDVPASTDAPPLALKLFLAAAERGEPQGAISAVELITEHALQVPGEVQAKVLELLQTDADAGNGRSLIVLADLYRNGILVPRSTDKARELYTKAIEFADEPGAYERLASLILQNAYSSADVREAIGLYDTASAAGSAAAMAAIGRIYLTGRGEVTAKAAEGERLLMEAADSGYGLALVQLADHLAKTASPESLARATKLYETARERGVIEGTIGLAALAAERGDRAGAEALYEEGVATGKPEAMVGLVRLLVSGSPDEATLERARSLVATARTAAGEDPRLTFDVAGAALAFPDEATRSIGLDALVRLAERGDSAAKKQLVQIYITGEAGVKSRADALRWAEDALGERVVDPAVILGEAMLSSKDLEFADPQLGRSLLERAVAMSPQNVKALNRLGTAYATGAGGPADPARAFAIYRRAADAGSVTAEIRVANAYLKGAGVARDPSEASRWYKRAAESGSSDAMVAIARMYASGAGTSIDAEQAFSWFHKAAALGSAEGMKEAGKALIAGYGTLRDEGQGLVWLERAASAGNASAMFDLYTFHSLKSGDPVEKTAALGWLRRSAEAGNAAAMVRLAQTIHDDPAMADRRDEAMTWLQRAAATGDKNSRRLLAKFAAAGRSGTGTVKDKAAETTGSVGGQGS